MIAGKSVIGIIPARGGSKGLPRKNILELAGKPLIAWTIDAAKASRYLDSLVLTSDDDEIIETAKHFGCESPVKRPAAMAGDEAPVGDAILHLLDHLEQPYDYFILLQPTSPFRSTDDIDGCIEKCVTRQAPACVGMVEPEKSPYWSFIADDEDRLTRLVEPGGPTHRRQGLPQVYASNGALFAASIPFFREAKRFFVPGTLGYVMPRERSIDIDDRLDFMFAELLIDQMGLGARD